MTDLSRVNTRRARTVLAAIAAGPLLIGVIVGTIAGRSFLGAVVGTMVGLVAGVTLAWWTAVSAPTRVLAAVGARPLADDEHQRLRNLVEGLSLTSGVPAPELWIIDDDAVDATVIGRSPRPTMFVVTSGLVDALDRIQLEGVVAHHLVRIRHDDVTLATLVAALGPLAPGLARRVLAADRITSADVEACQLTRYPPGLIGALEVITDRRMTHDSAAGRAHLWFARADPPIHPPLDERIALLREL